MQEMVGPTTPTTSASPLEPRLSNTLKAKIPKISRGWVLFGSVVCTWAGLRYRDRRLTNEIQADLRAQAQAIANEPLGPRERVRKVAVVLMRPHPEDSIRTSLDMFNSYIKPVFDAAALDYDLVQGFEPGTIVRHVSDTVAKKQHYAYWTDEDAVRASIMTTPNDDLGFFYRLHDYDAYVGVGRKPFEELVAGYVSGIARAKVELDHDYPVPTSSWWWSQPASSEIRPGLTLPPIAYVPLNTMTGWRTFPSRVLQWFNQHATARHLGTCALHIAQASHIRPLDPGPDPHLGVSEFASSFTLAHMGLPPNYEQVGPVLDPDVLDFWPPAPLPGRSGLSPMGGDGVSSGPMSAEAIINAAAEPAPKHLSGSAQEQVPVEKQPELSAEDRERRRMDLLYKYFVPRDVSEHVATLAALGVGIYEPVLE